MTKGLDVPLNAGIDEGHFTLKPLHKGEDCDHGHYTASVVEELGVVLCLYEKDPTRVSFHRQEDFWVWSEEGGFNDL